MDNERKGAPQYDSLDEKIIMLSVASTDTHGGPSSSEEMRDLTNHGIVRG